MIGHLKSWIATHLPRSSALPIIRLGAFLTQQHSLDDDAHHVFSEHGYHLLKKHFYLPIPEAADLENPFARNCSELVGLNMNEADSLNRLEKVFPPYAREFRETFPVHGDGSSRNFYLINGSFMAIDAQVYYGLIRQHRPKRIVEVGAGNSTRVAAEAVRRNFAEEGRKPDLWAIDPYPPDYVRDLEASGAIQLISERVQAVSMDVFTRLESGDILFIDSTHVLRQGGDVHLEYCEILPRLNPGVLVHIHDISLPKPYPKVYFDRRLYWNEQYLLQAFLAFNSRFEVIWPGNYMMIKHAERVCAVFPEYHEMRKVFPQSEPSSFWIRVKPS